MCGYATPSQNHIASNTSCEHNHTLLLTSNDDDEPCHHPLSNPRADKDETKEPRLTKR
jgi:hypothetical protein